MRNGRIVVNAAVLAALVALSACSGGGLFGGRSNAPEASASRELRERPDRAIQRRGGSSVLDLFANNEDPNTTVEVNKYLWNASLDVLSFMPVQAADPFTGVISFGYGVPPGGGGAYRATVHVSDPALDARGLHVALQNRSGRPVSTETQHAIEDAILGRARQLRIQDYDL